MNRITLAMIVSLAMLAAMFMLLRDKRSADPQSEPIMLFCAASNRAVMEAVKADYEAETGSRVDVQYGPSQSLLASIEVTRSGDLFLPADDSYLKTAREKELIVETLPIAQQQGVVAVRKGNPLNIRTFDDLLRSDVRLVQANPEAAAIAAITRRLLQQQGLWEKLDKATTAYRTTVNEVANDIQVEAADAGIVYDAVLHTFEDVEFVELPELKGVASSIGVGVIAGTQQSQHALRFARYLAARDRGQKKYTDFSFRVQEEGDEWVEVPEISIFAGSMLRPALEDTIKNFEQREGVQVTCMYNGCGILVGQMKAGQRPDAYFACDTEFMKQVPDLFPESVDVSQNELVILVTKGNPHDLKSLDDLTREGLRVGVGHEKQCAMGWLTQNTLKEAGLQDAVMANVTVQNPTGDFLVNQLLANALDAAIVYRSNATASADQVDVIPIQGLKSSIATQPFAIASESRYRQLSSRLFAQICSAQSQQGFLAEGFRWHTGAGSPPLDSRN